MITTLILSTVVLSKQTIHESIIEQYKKWDEAYLNHDVPKLAELLHRDFVLVTGRGTTMSRRDYIQRLWKSPMPELYSTTLLKTEKIGESVFAFTRETSKSPGETATEHEYQDTWVKSDNGWPMTESRTVGEH